MVSIYIFTRCLAINFRSSLIVSVKRINTIFKEELFLNLFTQTPDASKVITADRVDCASKLIEVRVESHVVALSSVKNVAIRVLDLEVEWILVDVECCAQRFILENNTTNHVGIVRCSCTYRHLLEFPVDISALDELGESHSKVR